MKQTYKNMLQEYLEEFLLNLNNRKIVILGCRGVSAVVYCALKSMGMDILYFLDPDTKYDKDHSGKKDFFGKKVFACNQLLYENPDEIAILNTYHYVGRIEPLLQSYGFVENEDYYNIHGCLKSKYCNVFDPILGYSRMDDMQGIKIFGEETEKSLKIVALGGSTTDYSYSSIKSWPEILHELLTSKGIKNVVYNGGVCGYSSCQERDKFLRDIIDIKPDLVLSLTGVNDINWTLVNKDNPYYADYFVNKMVKSICENTAEQNGSDDKLRLGLTPPMSDFENWYRNEKIIHGVATEFGIKFYAFLQPFIFEGKYEMSNFEKGWMKIFLKYGLNEHPAMKKIYEGYSDFYAGAKELTKHDDFIFDITNVFDDSIGVYTDGVHCDVQGNELLAQTIINKLIEAGELN
mgnify:FL=1